MQVRHSGLQEYSAMLAKMQAFTHARTGETQDELWLCEHPPVFTLGRHADEQHILNAHNIPVVKTDRGGQVTYHGPGQLLAYVLMDLKRHKWGVAELVKRLEQSVIETLALLDILAERRAGMPGVYIAQAETYGKICSVGLRVQKGCTYHGLALNVNLELTPFTYINPCGYQDLKMVKVQDFAPKITMAMIAAQLIPIMLEQLEA